MNRCRCILSLPRNNIFLKHLIQSASPVLPETRCREINIRSHPTQEFAVEQSETVENLNPGGILYCHGRNDESDRIVPTPFSRRLMLRRLFLLPRCVITFPQNSFLHTYHEIRMLQSSDQPPLPWNHEQTVAISAVRRACIVTKRVFETLVNTDYITKNDSSPVTGVLQSCSVFLLIWTFISG